MTRQLTAFFLSAAAALTLCGCGSMFDAEYVVESDYEPLISGSELSDTTVQSLDELKEVLRTMVAEGENHRRIAFDAAYEGDVSGDMASACWQVRTQDALCAYCVENISYDLSKIVNHYEATVSVSYSVAAGDVENIVRLPYAADVGEVLRQAMEQGCDSLVILIDRSSYTAEGIEDFAQQVYRENPAIAPQEPHIHVDTINGADTQRLYEFSFTYGLSASELAAQREALQALDPFSPLDTASLSEAERALLACRYLADNCRCTDDTQKSSIYAALIEGEADSQGMALAYVELCHRLNLACQLVEGQYNWDDHSWTIVEIEGESYHVDPWVCVGSGIAAGFLLNDEQAWGPYRWDYFAYPHCIGTLGYTDLLASGPQSAPEEAPAIEEAEYSPEEELPDTEYKKFAGENEISP